ncbi:Gfo/Idh/MocA family protein [Bacillus shivajii]|uniref:Gfo/Idh/MocA family protein n=1 Tax=Bacillus shivajii TaxID=1983719 RepID=UPI00299CFEF9|nr:Gfo/Idh/MocA family oxidoreductase [Bacillus shivajii]
MFYNSIEELLNSDIEAVIITSENARHRIHSEQAALAGKHILCEKPIATTLEDAKEIAKVCERERVFFQTAFPVRYSTPIKQAKRFIEDGSLGDILAMKGTNRGENPGGWFANSKLAGGGAIMDHTVHVTDIMRWYTNCDVLSVYAEIGRLFHEAETEDSGLLTLEFKNGAFATLDCSWSRNAAYPTWGDVMLDIIGTKGNLKIDAFGQRMKIYTNNGESWEFWGDDMNKEMIKDFIHRSDKGEKPAVTAQDGIEALRVALAAYQSASQVRTIHL